MRFILLLAATGVSIAMGFLTYLFLSHQLSDVMYALLSLGFSIAMTFIAFHFIYLSYVSSKENKRQFKAFSQKEKKWEQTKLQVTSDSALPPNAPLALSEQEPPLHS